MASGDRLRGIWPAERLAALAAKAAPDSPIAVAAGEAPTLAIVPVHATLGEALGRLEKADADAAVVIAGAVARVQYVRGVISRSQIDAGVRYRRERSPPADGAGV
jgi:hypothetical protein